MKSQLRYLNFPLFFLLFGLIGCEKHIKRPSADITFADSALLYCGKLFSGVVETELQGVNVIRKTPYRNGLMNGMEEEFYENGQIAARREYSEDKKVGIHETWYSDGKRRAHYEYSNNQYDGEVWEWYNSGALAIYARFEKGRSLGKKFWREDGKIYMNYVFPKGRPIGLPGTHLCFQVRSGVKN
jgi:hypothetical protein